MFWKRNSSRRLRSDSDRKQRRHFIETLEARHMLAFEPLGDEMLVNDSITRAQLSVPRATAVAVADSGHTIVTFSGRGPLDDSGVFAKIYGPDGNAVRPDFRVNSTVNEEQKAPVVAIEPLGNSVIAWQGRGVGDQSGIFLQHLSADGTLIGTERLVNTTTGGAQKEPSIAMAAEGQFVVVWSGVGDGDFDGIFSRRFDSNGEPTGPEFRVNSTTNDQQAEPVVAMSDDGSFVVAWSSRHQDGSDWGVYAQAYDAQGVRRGSEVRINAAFINAQQSPAVTIDQDGSYAVAWSSLGQDGDSWSIIARRFGPTGNPLTPERLVNSLTIGHQVAPSIATTPRGGFTVTWTSGLPDGSGWEVYARAFDDTGIAEGDAVRVNARMAGFASGHQSQSSLAIDARGQTTVVYSGIGPEDFGGVWLRRASGGDACPFDNPALASWKFEQTDGSAAGQGRVDFVDCLATIREGDSFVAELRTSFVVPESPGTLSFSYDSLMFDPADKSFINDAFEAALVDENGNSYVGTYLPNRDAFYNDTEELAAVGGDQTTFSTIDDVTTVTVDLADLIPGTQATFILRLVNNDSDTGTSVRIVGYDVPAFGSVPMNMLPPNGDSGLISTVGTNSSIGSLHTVSTAGTSTSGTLNQTSANSSIVTTTSLAGSTSSATAAPSPAASAASSSTTPPAADLNQDGIVDQADLSIMVGRYGAEGIGLPEDLDGDGRVGIKDVLSLRNQLGATWSVDTTPTSGTAEDDDDDTLLGDDGTVTFTTSDDFLAGTLFNVNVTTEPDALRLNEGQDVRTFPFIWVANSGEGTVSKFDTRTGKEIGRYRTGPNAVASWLSPSRTAVDGDGNVWVANRSHVSGSHQQGSIVKVLNEDFFDRNGNGVMDTSQDLNGDGRISGAEVMAWDANGDGLPDDERIALSIDVGRNRSAPYGLRAGAAIPRATALDANDNIWVGLFNFGQYEVYDGQTGEFLAVVATDGAPYGAVIDADGQLWSANRGSYLDHIDTNTRTYAGHSPNHGGDNYGITVGSDGVVWAVTYSGSRLVRFDPKAAAGSQVTTYGAPGIGSFRGVGVDNSGNVWVAANSPNRIVKFTFAEDGVTLLSTQSVAVGNTASAAVIDADGFVWTTTYGDNLAWKIDPLTVTVVAGWPIPTGIEPYNYSDMTGQVRITSTGRTGSWTEILDAERERAVWGRLDAATVAPANTSIEFRVRASDQRGLLASLPWTIVHPGDSLAELQGRFLEIEIKLQSQAVDAHPSVTQLTINTSTLPAIEVLVPANNSSLPADLRLPLTGIVREGRTSSGGGSIGEPIPIELVTVNGLPVDVLDSGGNFFSVVDILPGENVFTVTATDIFGQVSTETVTVTGTQATPGKYDFRQFADITGSFTGVYARTSFDHSSKMLYADLATRNDGTFVSDVPLLVGIKNISDPTVLVADADGATPDGIPFFDYSTLVPEGTLDVEESTGPLTISFFNPLRKNFTYELVFYGKLNTPPLITTVPNLEAIIGKPYTYDVDATDLDGDSLTYTLLNQRTDPLPTALRIDPVTGIISWSPTVADQGNRVVVVRVEDGRTGVAEQTYQLNTIVAPPNRPPIITSVPITIARTETAGDRIKITFDELQGVNYIPGTQVPEPSRLSDQYLAAHGVRFRSFAGLPYAAIVNLDIYAPGHAPSAPNGFGGVTSSGTLSYSTPIVATFFVPGQSSRLAVTDYVSFRTDTVGDFGRVSVDAFDIFGNLIGSVSAIDHSSPIVQISAPGIHSVRINGSGSSGLDDFTFGAVMLPEMSGYSYDVDARDPDQDTLSYSLVDDTEFDIPAGMTINSSNGVIRWGPTPEQSGQVYPVKVRVSDGRGGIAEQAFSICVLEDGQTVEIIADVDLQVRDVDQSGLTFDPQLLAVSGQMQASIHNAGADDVTTPFEVLFFEDLNGNDAYDAAVDRALGRTDVRQVVPAGGSIPATAEIVGAIQFAGNRIWVYVDSQSVVNESNETNNLAVQICTFTPTPGVFDPALEWSWDSSAVQSSALNVMMTPAIVDLDGDRIPDVVFGSTASTGGNVIEVGYLRAISGRDGNELFTVTSPGLQINTTTSVAVGDIDLDGRPEIIASDPSGNRLLAFEHDGQLKWRSDVLESYGWGGIAIADIDHDGVPEIVLGRQVVNSNGTLRWTGTGGRALHSGPLSLVANIDLVGNSEVVAGNTVYNAAGQVVWQNGLPDGHNAIGNFDSDEYPEIILVNGGRVWLLEHTGETKWGPVIIPGGGIGGPPTVADYDGDGMPEIGIASASRYVVFETDGSVKWQAVTQDTSSSVTGSSVFDFEGDGRAEVVYRDELHLRVYDGTTGTVRFEVPMSSCTWHEYVLVADVDADGNAEIVATANNNCGKGPQQGIRVYGSSSDSWVATRQIWNQHTYHISNVNEDGTIPAVEDNSWQTHNTYRLNAFASDDPNQARIAPDLTSSFARAIVNGSDQTLTTRIGNGGSAFVLPGVNVSFYDGDPAMSGRLLGTVQTATLLDPGEYEDVTFDVSTGTVADLWVVADDDGTGRSRVGECDETNNKFHPGLQTATPNAIPQFATTPVESALEGRAYRYDVDATDADAGDVVTYALRYGPAGMTINADTGIVTWTPGSSAAGKQNVQIIADDGRGGRKIQIFDIDVAEALNALPQITSVAVVEANHGSLYSYNVLATDTDGDALTYSLLTAPVGMTIHPHQGWIRWTPTIEQIGEHEVLLRVQDSTGAGAIQGFQVEVRAANEAPAFTSTPPRTATAGMPYEYRAAAQDANGDAITYRLDSLLLSGMQFDPVLGIVRWTPATNQIGSHPVAIAALDGRGGVTSQSYQLEVVATSENVAPTINTLPRTTVRVGHSYAYVSQATDANGDPLTYTLEVAPDGMTLGLDSEENPTAIPGLIYWTPNPEQLGNHPVRLAVTDLRGGRAQQEFTISVLSQSTNGEPTIVSTPRSLSTVVGRAFQYNLTARDPDNDPLTWRLVAGPVGMSLDAMHGTLRWSPDGDQLGQHTVSVEVTDPFGASDTQTFTVGCSCTNLPPAITSRPSTQATTDVPYLYAVRATDPERDPLTYYLDAASLARGMTIDAERGIIRWTPTAAQAGSHEVTVRVEDGAGGVATQRYSIFASIERPNVAPVITSRPLTAATAEAPYLYQAIATDADGDSIRYSLGTILPGLSIEEVSGQILWTPTADQVRTEPYEITAIASDGRARAYQTFSVFVRANVPPEITSTPKDRISAGATYRYSVIATDENKDPLTYALVAGPDGMTIDRLGRIFWSPMADDIRPEPYPVEVQVSDPRGATDSQPWTILVKPDDVAPQVSIQVIVGVRVYTDNATVDYLNEVTFQVVATDDVGVTNLSLTVNGEALGLDENGRTRKVMNRHGIVSAVASATDAAGNPGHAAMTVNVVDPASNPNNVPNVGNPTLPPHQGPFPGDTTGPEVAITRFVYSNPAERPDVLFTPPNTPVAVSEAVTEASVTDPIKIYGTVDDPEDHLWYYDVLYARADQVDLQNFDLRDPDYIRLARGTTEVTDGELATFDPTMLSRDPYAIVLVAFDFNGQGFVHYVTANVEGNLVLGNFRLEFNDLSVPLVGIPITINRVYDTTQASTEGDFGYGWSLGLQDARILETKHPEAGFVKDKTKVYLTNPSGQRVGFTYKESAAKSCFVGCVYDAFFEPDPGVYDQLVVPNPEVAHGGLFDDGLGSMTDFDTYILTTKDGVKYRYHQTRGLEFITDRNGNTVTFTDAGIVHSSGDSIAFIRDNRGRIKQIIDPAGNPVVYQYNAAGDLVKYTDQAGVFTSYSYLSNPAHYPDEAHDSLGNRVLKVEYENGVYVGVLDAFGNRVNQQDIDLASSTAVVRDGNGNATTLLYDDRGNVLEETDAEGYTTYREYTDPRHPDLETRVIDRNGNIADRTYDASGNVKTITERGSTANPLAAPVVTSFTYNARNEVSSITNALGKATGFGYNPSGNINSITNTLGDSSGFTYDAQGRRETFTDFNGNTTTFSYTAGCPCGSPDTITFADDTYQKLQYNGFGHVTLEEFYEADGTLVERKQTKYDSAGRVTEEIMGAAGDPDHPPTIVRKFYKGNLLDWEIIVHPESLGAGGVLLESPATAVSQRKSRITDYEYDAQGRLVKQIDAMGGVVDFRYDAQGNRIALRDPVGNITTWVYDGANRVVEERDPFYWEKVRAADAALAALSDDGFLERIAPLDPVVPGSSDPRDPLYDDPSGADCDTNTAADHVRLTCYDGEGNQAKTIDRNARRREFEYDHAGRLLEERWYNAPEHVTAPLALVETITFSYDTLGNMLTATDTNSNNLFKYDTLNRLESVDNNPDSTRDVPRVILTYGYDKQGNVTLTKDNFGVTVASTYNERNLLETRKWFDVDGSGDVDDARVDFQYNAANRESAVQRYSDLNATAVVGSTARTYDLAGRSDILKHCNALACPPSLTNVATLLAGYDYDYNFSGLLSREQLSHQDAEIAQIAGYGYDLTGQLTDALLTDQDDEHYEYDANGNRSFSRIGSETRNYTTDTSNQLVKDGRYHYEYDGEGNQVKRVDLTTGETRTFEYDHRNRIVRLNDWSRDPGIPQNPSPGVILTQTLQHTFDAFDRPTSESANVVVGDSGVRHFAFNGDNIWLSHGPAADGTLRLLLGRTIDDVLAFQSLEESVTWNLVGRFGTTVALESDGKLTNVRMTSYGFPVGSISETALFAGRQFDAFSELYFMRSRHYDPFNGRFLQADALAVRPTESNQYRYVFNSPQNDIDPSGKLSMVEFGIITGGVAAATRAFLGVAGGESYGEAIGEGIKQGLVVGLLTSFFAPAFALESWIWAVPIGGLAGARGELFEITEFWRHVRYGLNSLGYGWLPNAVVDKIVYLITAVDPRGR